MRTRRIPAAVAATVVALLSLGAVAAQAAVTPPSGPVAGGTAVVVDVPQNRFTQLSGGYSHVVGLAADDTVWAWGGNPAGQLGDGTTTGSPVPVRVLLPAGITVTQVAAGPSSSMALTDTGAVYAWGSNSGRQLADGTTDNSPTPVLASALSGVPVASLHTGYSNSATAGGTVFAITTTGDLYAWGSNFGGKYGNGTTATATAPVLVGTLPSGVVALDASSGLGHSLVLGSDGLVYTTGGNSNGELGLGTVGGPMIPTLGPASLANVPAGVTFTAVAAGRVNNYALGDDGRLYSWGNNTGGSLGDGTTTPQYLPTPITLPGGATVAQIATWQGSGYLVTTDGAVHSWGLNGVGQLGDGTTNTPNPTPTAVALGLPTGVSIQQLAPTNDGLLLLLSDGTVRGWGNNSAGEVGDGTTTQRLNPMTALSPVTVSDVTFGGVPAASFADLGTTVSSVTPPHAAGSVDAVVATQTRSTPPLPGPSHTETAGFTYLAPVPAAPSDPPLPGEDPDLLGAADPACAGEPSRCEATVPGPTSIPGETDLAYTGMSSGAPAVALLGAALAALGVGTWTLRTVLRKQGATG